MNKPYTPYLKIDYPVSEPRSRSMTRIANPDGFTYTNCDVALDEQGRDDLVAAFNAFLDKAKAGETSTFLVSVYPYDEVLFQ